MTSTSKTLLISPSTMEPTTQYLETLYHVPWNPLPSTLEPSTQYLGTHNSQYLETYFKLSWNPLPSTLETNCPVSWNPLPCTLEPYCSVPWNLLPSINHVCSSTYLQNLLDNMHTTFYLRRNPHSCGPFWLDIP